MQNESEQEEANIRMDGLLLKFDATYLAITW